MSHNYKGSSGNLVLLSSQSASNSASLTFTSVITSAFDLFFLRFYDVILQTNGQLIMVQVSTDNGLNYSSSGYEQAGSYAINGSVDGIGFEASTTAGFEIAGGSDNTSTSGINGESIFYGFNNASVHKKCTTQSGSIFASNNGTFNLVSTGTWATTTAINAIKVLASSGNLVSGKFKLYGIVN